jgi:hypothetical protein
MIIWKRTTEQLPLENVPIFLDRTKSEDLLSSDFGHLITNSDGQVGWFTGDINKVLTLESRPYWIYAKENVVEIHKTAGSIDEDSGGQIGHFLDKLRLYEMKFKHMAAWMIKSGKGIYHLDFYVSAILNRSISLINGFQTLINNSNYLSAAHLVRPHLDNYLRLLAAWLVESPHDFAQKVWEGGHVRKMKDKSGKLMTDDYLKKKAAEEHPWIENVYNESSGFIHFSNKHMFMTTSLLNKEERILSTYIGEYDNKVPNAIRLESIICMIEICNCLTDLVFGWVDTKRIVG